MKKKSIQRIAAWLLAAGMMAGTFAQPMAAYAESTASIAASDSTTGDSITADADVVIATPTPEPDTGTDTAATPGSYGGFPNSAGPGKHSCARNHPGPRCRRGCAHPDAHPGCRGHGQTMPPTRTTPPIRPPPSPRADLAKLHRPAGGLAAQPGRGQYRARCPRGDPALSDEITETEPSTLQAVVNAAVYAAPESQTDIKVDVPAHNYTGTLVIPDGNHVGNDASGTSQLTTQTKTSS